MSQREFVFPGPIEPIEFKISTPLSLGVEIEVQLVDWKSAELCPAAPRLLKRLRSPTFQPEYFQSNLEIVTGVCDSLAQADGELRRAVRRLLEEADALGIDVLGAGTHPLDGGHRDEPLFPSERYRKVHERSRWAASYMSTFGLHVHVGAGDGPTAMQLIHGISPYLAHLLALSASSPFAAGTDTGLASSRVTVFESLPTAGTPPQLATWKDFEQLIGRLMRAGAVESFKDLLWDVRPSPNYGTVEVRICDAQASLSDTLGLVAAIRGLFTWLYERIQSGEHFEPTPTWRLRENKWRAARYGMEAEIIVDDEGRTAPVRTEWGKLMTVLASSTDPVYLALLGELLERGPSSERQRSVYRVYGSLRTVVQHLAAEWREDAQSRPARGLVRPRLLPRA